MRLRGCDSRYEAYLADNAEAEAAGRARNDYCSGPVGFVQYTQNAERGTGPDDIPRTRFGYT